jgi:aminoglycoside phosphotransferase (APT) family kinase protein
LNVVLLQGVPVVIDWEMARIDAPLFDIAMSQVHTEIAMSIGEFPQAEDRFAYGRLLLDAYCALRPIPEGDLRYFRALAACRRLTDVARALRRAGLDAENRAELEAEGAAAISLLDREIGFAGREVFTDK